MIEQLITARLAGARRVLLAGCGGGYDILGAVPIAQVLRACVGLGAELRDGIAHAQVFEQIAALSRAGAYLGASALVPGTAPTDAYLDAVADVFAHQAQQKRSHVHAVVTAACRGEFGAT